MQARSSFVLFAATAVSLLSLAIGCRSRTSAEPRIPDRVVKDSRSARLFVQHCALCHGEDGSGRGPGFGLLEPPVPDFGSGRFSLVSTTNGVPSLDDLVATLRRGMPGSAMPPFSWMSERDLRGLAQHVRTLGTRRMAKELRDDARRSGGMLDETEALEIATQRFTPGAQIEIPGAIPSVPETLASGKKLYARHCAACHGDDGKGRGPIRAWRDVFDFRLARDFTVGILRGTASHEALSARVLAGMPRAGMPPTELDAQDTASLVAYVKSLMPKGSEDRLLQKKIDLRARRVETLPATADDASWVTADARRIVLSPLAWSEDAIVQAQVAALHDGDELAIRLTWQDASEDRSPIASDGAAVQFSKDLQPPLFGMGSRSQPVNIWHWRAFRLKDVAGELDLLDTPHARRDPTGKRIGTDGPVYRPTPPLRTSRRTAETLRAEGMRGLQTGHGGTAVAASYAWSKGTWHVVLRRKLKAVDEREIEFEAGDVVQFGVALWNGAERRSTSFKSITIWHTLRLDR